MSGLINITVEEARGPIAIGADIDNTPIIVGCSSAGSGLSNFFLSATSAIASVGYGDAVDVLTQNIEQLLDGGSSTKLPAALYTVPGSTPGAYGTIDITDVVGTCRPANDESTEPYGTYQAAIQWVTGCTVGTTGGTYKWSLDNGRTWSNVTALGTSYYIDIPNSAVTFYLGLPTAQDTALVTFAVEARSDTLAHLANVVAHDAADTSAAQVALAASSVPATPAAAWAVLNLCLAALDEHELNLTAHNGPDYVNAPTAPAATNTQTGATLAANYLAKYNAHLGISVAGAAAGLLAATATVAAPVALTTSDFIAGASVMNTYPRRIEFTTAGMTPSDAPATATINGFVNGVAQGPEVVNVPQTATTASSALAWDFTGLTIDYPAAQGTAATVAIGYGKGVHNSADSTNTIAAPAPTHGTLLAGDTWSTWTSAPAPSTSDIDAAATAIAASSVDFGLIYFAFDVDAAMAAHVTSLLNTLAAVGKRPTACIQVRPRDFSAGESETTWFNSVAADFAAYTDSRVCKRASYGFITDAVTGRVYLRADFAAFTAEVTRVGRSVWPDSPNALVSGIPLFTLIDSAGDTIGHDEGPQGAITGLSNPSLGNTFSCVQRLAVAAAVRQNVYNCVPWVSYDTGERIQTLMVRRVANAFERTMVVAEIPTLGARLAYTTTGATSGKLTPASVKLVQATIFQACSSAFSTEVDNWQDADLNTGLIQVNPVVTVAPGKLLAVAVTGAPNVGGYVQTINNTFAVQL